MYSILHPSIQLRDFLNRHGNGNGGPGDGTGRRREPERSLALTPNRRRGSVTRMRKLVSGPSGKLPAAASRSLGPIPYAPSGCSSMSPCMRLRMGDGRSTDGRTDGQMEMEMDLERER